MRRALICIGLLTTLATPAFAQDSDLDGTADPIDAFPCDPAATAASYAPGAGAFGTLLFEDMWPEAGDLDFNDAVIAYNVEVRLDSAQQARRVIATFDVIALGGDHALGLGLHLPVARDAVSGAQRTVAGSAQPLSVSMPDAQATFFVADDLRALFNVSGRINADPGQTASPAQRIVVQVDLTPGVSLDLGAAPFDVFVFRTQDPSLEVHRPAYAGTSRLDASAFGTADDASTPGRHFVEAGGVPFALAVPVDTAYPAEGRALSGLYPDLLVFASSGGASAADYYTRVGDGALAFTDAAGQPAPSPGALSTAADLSCMTCTDGLQNQDETGVDCGGTSCAPCPEVVYDAAGTSYAFTVPAGVTQLEVLMWGAGGGGARGGAGGYTYGLVDVTPGEVLGVEVGGADYGPQPSAYQTYPAGGGRSALVRGSRTQEILVAGGGGAGSSYSGGAGGGLNGQHGLGGPSTRSGFGQQSYNTPGATASGPGAGGCSTYWSGHNRCGTSGSRIHGSRGHNNGLHQGGFGGGGYYGGGSGGATAYSGAGGGGGSGFVAPTGVTQGTTIGGDRAVPGNANDLDRGTAGEPGQPGLVILRY